MKLSNTFDIGSCCARRKPDKMSKRKNTETDTKSEIPSKKQAQGDAGESLFPSAYCLALHCCVEEIWLPEVNMQGCLVDREGGSYR